MSDCVKCGQKLQDGHALNGVCNPCRAPAHMPEESLRLPLPWFIAGDGGDLVTIRTADNALVAQSVYRKDARFIVTACNSHYELLEACRAIIKMNTYQKELLEALDSFPRYMNRPLARVHVYTWRLAVLLEPPNAPAHGIRLRKAYRDAVCVVWRKTVAAAVRLARSGGHKIKLPCYYEAKGEYLWPKDAEDYEKARRWVAERWHAAKERIAQ